MSSDSSFNIHSALYFVKHPSRATQNPPEGRRLKTPDVHNIGQAKKAMQKNTYINYNNVNNYNNNNNNNNNDNEIYMLG